MFYQLFKLPGSKIALNEYPELILFTKFASCKS